jgi:hypothetical protein
MRTIFNLLNNNGLMVYGYLFKYGSGWVGGGPEPSSCRSWAEHGLAELGQSLAMRDGAEPRTGLVLECPVPGSGRAGPADEYYYCLAGLS